MKTKTITIPEIDDCSFRVECLPEFSRVRGNASAIDDEIDAAIEAEINRQLDNGNPWAWCTVKVTCYYDAGLGGIEGEDYLGCCSYESERDFVESSGYFEDMKAQSYADFVRNIEAL